jgi:hypothetical protein
MQDRDRERFMDETGAIARLSYLDVEIRHRRLPEEQAEQLAISLRATPLVRGVRAVPGTPGALALGGAAAMADVRPNGPGELAALAPGILCHVPADDR